MSTISNAITRTVLLWAYVGIGPMIGAGPLDAPPVRRGRTAREPVPQRDLACGPAPSLEPVSSSAGTLAVITTADPAKGASFGALRLPTMDRAE